MSPDVGAARFEVGVMAREAGSVASVDELPTLAARIAGEGFRVVQLNLGCVGLSTLPASLTSDLARRIYDTLAAQGLSIASLSGTFNTIHPDPTVRAAGVRGAAALAARCRDLGTEVITLSTGTRDTEDMWRAHPDNAGTAAWRDLTATMRELAAVAETHGVMVAFEPETGNVVDSAQRAERLIAEIGSRAVRVVIDPANLLRPETLPMMAEIVTEATNRLGLYLALAHAKDVAPPVAGEVECRRVAPGDGVLDFALYFRRLRDQGYSGPVIMHGLAWEQAARCRRYLEGMMGT
jgi:sugar phosphate isomerase/epimerase